MKKFLFILCSLVVISKLAAQNSDYTDISALLENKIWKVQAPKDKQYAMEMEFRDAGWKKTFLYDEKKTETFYSYSLCGDTIKVFESRKKYIIQELTDSTLVFQYLPDSLTMGVGSVKCVTDNSIEGQRKNEERLDGIWRKEEIWNMGVTMITGEPVKDLSTIEPPRWAVWDYDLTKYYVAKMKYPEELLKKNRAGYSVVMFSIDTLGLPRAINILTTKYKDFDKEVIRLTKELPHCLPCRDKNGKRMECLYTVYVPFLPQHYKDRVRKDSIWEEEQKHCFVEWESPSRFMDGNPRTIQNYIDERLVYDPSLLGNKEQVRGFYKVKINSYGEVSEVDVFRSCGIHEWDAQVVDIIKGMPRWTPAISYYGKSKYRESIWTMNVFFRKTKGKLIAHTFEKNLETGVPVCFLNERGDTIVPYGKYNYCQINRVKNLVFAYENKQDTRIVCLNGQGEELFYVFQYDNGPDKLREGLFRITDENGLISFADSLGNIVIKPQFKFAFPFENGKAKVTFSGESKVVPDSKDEKYYWDSPDWYYIDTNGKIL